MNDDKRKAFRAALEGRFNAPAHRYIEQSRHAAATMARMIREAESGWVEETLGKLVADGVCLDRITIAYWPEGVFRRVAVYVDDREHARMETHP